MISMPEKLEPHGKANATFVLLKMPAADVIAMHVFKILRKLLQL
jgi:hypothetical protein